MSTNPSSVAYHLMPESFWLATPADEPIRPASLATEGFVHLTHRLDDLIVVANTFYRSEPGPHVVLTIALPLLSAPWRYDGDDRFPHVYGPIDREAVTGLQAVRRDAIGAFLPIG